MPAIHDKSDSDNGRGTYGLVWAALDRFSEALRDLDGEVRALAQVFEQPHDRKSPADGTPGRFRQTYE